MYLENISYLITIVGVPIAIFVYLREQKRQREEREYGTYDALDDKYIELQQLCLSYSNLDVFDTPFAPTPKLTEEQKKQEEAILLIRISIFERAYLMYTRTDSNCRNEQWAGWELEIKEWFSRDNFRATWNEHKQYFAKSFVNHFDVV